MISVPTWLVVGLLLLMAACHLPTSGIVPSPTTAPQRTINWDNIVVRDARPPVGTAAPLTPIQSALPSSSPVAAPQASVVPSPATGTALPDWRTLELWDGIQNPCQGFRAAMWRAGVNPNNLGALGAQLLLKLAWRRTLPVLVGIAANPAVAGDPDALTALIDQYVLTTVNYESPGEVLQFIESAAQRGMPGPGGIPASTEPGDLLLASIWGDPARREAWTFTAYYGGLTGSTRESMVRFWRDRTGTSAVELTRC
jgi:hypothetical protein